MTSLIHQMQKLLHPTTKAQLQSEGHQRLLPPLLVFLFSLIGLSALLPQELNRRGRQKRITLAIGIATCLHISLVFLININGRWSFTIPFAYILVVLVGITSLIILEKQGILLWWQQYTQRRIAQENMERSVSP